MKYQRKACITLTLSVTIDSVMRMKKNNYLQVYLEKFKNKSKKTKMTKFINTELESESDSKLESDAELELKSESY